MGSKAYAFLLGVIATFAGLAVAEFSSSRLIDLFGGAVVLSGLGAAAWACGKSFLWMYIGVLLITALIVGLVFLADPHLMSR